MSDLPTNSPDTFGAASHSGEDSVMSALNLLDIAPDTDPHRPRPGVQRVLSGDGANLILFSFAPGQSLPEHKAAHPITVQALRGELDFSYGSETITLTPGSIVHLPAYEVHKVEATSESGNPSTPAILLLTMLTK